MANLFNISKNKSVHINCTLPSVLKSKDGTYTMSEENLLTQIISLMSIKYYTQKETILLTDIPGLRFYEKVGLNKLYDKVDVDVVTLFTEDIKTDHESFYVSAKTFGLFRLEPPFLFFDLDFILLQDIPKTFFKNDIVYAHNEILRKEHMYSLQDLQGIGLFPSLDFDETIMMPNVCFVYMNNKELQKIYEKENLYIIQTKYENGVPEWLFLHSEQGCLGQILHKHDNFKASVLKQQTFLQYPTHKKTALSTPAWVTPIGYDESKDVKFYHLWDQKSEVFNNPKIKKYYQHLVYDFIYNKGMKEFLVLEPIKNLLKNMA